MVRRSSLLPAFAASPRDATYRSNAARNGAASGLLKSIWYEESSSLTVTDPKLVGLDGQRRHAASESNLGEGSRVPGVSSPDAPRTPYPVTAILWFWHQIFGRVLDPASGIACALAVAIAVVAAFTVGALFRAAGRPVRSSARGATDRRGAILRVRGIPGFRGSPGRRDREPARAESPKPRRHRPRTAACR